MIRFAMVALAATTLCASAGAEDLPAIDQIAPDVVEAKAYAVPAPFRSRFDGAYAAVTGGYDFDAKNQQTSAYYSPLTSFDAIRGGKVGGVGGYNVTSGRLLIGFEARVQYAFGEDAGTSSYAYTNPLPALIGGCFGSGCSSTGYPIGNYQLSSLSSYSERLSRPFSGDISMRAGILLDDAWLAYGRVGVGAEYNKMVTTSDATGVATCNNAIVTGVPRSSYGTAGYDYYVTGCGSITRGSVTTITTTKIAPTVTLAAGFEHNFGAIFARAEAELLVHFPALTASQVYYSPAMNLAIGYRF